MELSKSLSRTSSQNQGPAPTSFHNGDSAEPKPKDRQCRAKAPSTKRFCRLLAKSCTHVWLGKRWN